MATQELVVAHVGAVEEDLLELNAPANDPDLDAERVVEGDDGGNNGGNDGGGAASGTGAPAAVDGGTGESDASDIDVSDASSILSDEASSSEVSLPSTTDDDDTDSIISNDGDPRRIVTVTVSTDSGTREVANAIVGDDQSAEADANAVPEVGSAENRLDESIPWEEYVVPDRDGGGDDDGGDDGDGDDDGDDEDADNGLDLGPVDRARMLFRNDLALRLEAYRASGVADALMVQMLTHG